MNTRPPTIPMIAARRVAFSARADIQRLLELVLLAIHSFLPDTPATSHDKRRLSTGALPMQGRRPMASPCGLLWWVKKRAGARPDAPALETATNDLLLNRDHSLHAHREVRRAIVRIRASLDVAEGDGDGLPGVHLHCTRQVGQLVGAQVGIQLCLYIGRDGRWIEGYVVRASADRREPDAVSRLDRDVCRLEAIAFRVAHHFDFVRCAGDRCHGARACRRCSSGRSYSRGGCGGDRGSICCYTYCIGVALVPAGACAEEGSSGNERQSIKPHSEKPPDLFHLWLNSRS